MSGEARLVGDVGGTNARFALARLEDGRPVFERMMSFPAADHPTFADGMRAYLDACDVAPTGGVIAVAGPVANGEVDLTNSPWTVSEAELRRLGLDPVTLINDFEAQGWGAPLLGPGDRVSVGGPEAGLAGKTLAILGPGTGFGLSAWTPSPNGGGGAVLATEAGHQNFAPTDALEDEVLKVMRARFGRVSIERILCGPGLVNLHQALAEIDGRPVEAIEPADITERGLKDEDSAEARTLNLFCAVLGSVAGDIALTIGARAGIYVSGGIAPRILPVLQFGAFRARFEDKGRYRAYVAAIPTWVVTHPHPGLLGAARLALA